MSTAFLVDNILNDKDDNLDTIMSSDSSDSDATSDLKDSICDSPPPIQPSNYHHNLHHHIRHHNDHLLNDQDRDQHERDRDDDHEQDSINLNNNTTKRLSDDLLRTYNTMIRDNNQRLGIEVCCAKCNCYQFTRNNNHQHNDDTSSKTPTPPTAVTPTNNQPHQTNDNNSDDDLLQVINFKCEKCGSCDYVNDKETILKETTVKPVLKFSVSAILGDRKDCVKVRNGKILGNWHKLF